MLKEAELITTYTGIDYLKEDIIAFSDAYTSTSSSSLNPVQTRREVVRESRPSLGIQSDLYSSPLLNEFTLQTTGNELSDFFFLVALFGSQITAITDYRITYSPIRLPAKRFYHVLSDETLSAKTPAERLRAISGLEVEPLANIFKVSRATYHKWINGSAPNRKHREHLLEVLSHIEKATQRLGSQSATTNWLLTPISATGKKPIDYLTMRQYAIFRGFLLNARTGQEVIRPPNPSNRVYREFSKEDVESALERLRPRAWVEDDDKE